MGLYLPCFPPFVPRKRSNAGVRLADPDVRRWYDNLARGSQGTADVAVRRLAAFCDAADVTPAGLLALPERRLHDLFLDFVSAEEKRGKAGSYTLKSTTAVRSWLKHNGISLSQALAETPARFSAALRLFRPVPGIRPDPTYEKGAGGIGSVGRSAKSAHLPSPHRHWLHSPPSKRHGGHCRFVGPSFCREQCNRGSERNRHPDPAGQRGPPQADRAVGGVDDLQARRVGGLPDTLRTLVRQRKGAQGL
jgi:hypothetical protein